ncbi:Non-specific serine/threonine protein kinase [Forsythia ovata]|uniref:Non-specific serine/threonine protein kinase n=1 Tax=Forsythia ovata TaxID=205694 RepID=A0ABD1T7P5_9LAMI
MDFHPTYDANGMIEFNVPVPFHVTRNLQAFFLILEWRPYCHSHVCSFSSYGFTQRIMVRDSIIQTLTTTMITKMQMAPSILKLALRVVGTSLSSVLWGPMVAKQAV